MSARVTVLAMIVAAATASADISVDDPRVAARKKRDERLTRECAAQLASHDAEFRRCWALYQHPDATSGHRKPFFDITVGADGRVADIVHFKTDTPAARVCLRAVIEHFEFTAFSDEERVHLGILEYPSRCDVVPPR